MNLFSHSSGNPPKIFSYKYLINIKFPRFR